MQKIKNYTKQYDHFHVHYVQTKKFKSVQIVVQFRSMLNREDITKRALIPYILEKGTASYPTEKSLTKKLDDLYGANLSIYGSKAGNDHVVNIKLELANEKFLPHQDSLTEEAFKLLHEIIYKPNTEHHIFPEKLVEREKITLQNDIDSIYDDKVIYANQRLIEEMCENELFSISTNGYKEDLHSITAENLYDYYKHMIQTDQLNIFVIGDIEVKDVEKFIIQTFQPPKPQKLTSKIDDSSVIEPNNIVEYQPIQQAKLHMGFRTNCRVGDDQYPALLLFNALFGVYPNSKLFQEVREKENLAYYVSSRIESLKGLLIVFAGIDGKQSDKTINIILSELAKIKEGNVSLALLEETKQLYINDMKESLDSPSGIIAFYQQQIVSKNNYSVEEWLAEIKKVTVDDIVQVSKAITLDTIYVLTNRKEVGCK